MRERKREKERMWELFIWCNWVKWGVNKSERARKLSWKLRQAPPLANSKAQRFACLLVRRPISNWPGRAASKVVQSVNAQKNALPRGHTANCENWYELHLKTHNARSLSTRTKIFTCFFSFTCPPFSIFLCIKFISGIFHIIVTHVSVDNQIKSFCF